MEVVDHGAMRLGKRRGVVEDPRTFRLASFLDAASLPSLPKSRNLTRRVTEPWRMFANDRIGDCGLAGQAHMDMCWLANVSRSEVYTPTDREVIAAYSAVSGYDPSTGANDNGVYLLDALNWWRRAGIEGRRIEAFVKLDTRVADQFRYAVQLFGGAYIGLALPVAAQTQTKWTAPGPGPLVGEYEPGSWGGHCVNLVQYDVWGVTCVTWGELKRISWGFLKAYCDEAYAVLSPDWIKGTGKAPGGFLLDALRADLARL